MPASRLVWRGWYLLQRLRGSLQPQLVDWRGIEVAFLISTGRTATQTLASVLDNGFERVEARHEPWPDLFDIATAHARSERSLDQTAAAFRAARIGICRHVHRRNADYYVESNNNAAYIIPAVWAALPAAKIVHIVRDGRAFVRSSYSKTVGQRREDLFMTEKDPRRRLQASDLADDPWSGRWATMNRFERLCWYWAKKDGMISDAVAGDDRAMTVKFEEIFNADAGYPGFWRIVDFLNIRDRLMLNDKQLRERISRKENRTQRYLLGHWSEWSPEQMARFRTIAGPHMSRWGYNL